MTTNEVNNDLEMRNNRSLGVLGSLGLTLILGFFLFQEHDQLFNFKNVSLVNWVLLIFLSSFAAITWIWFFDESVKVIINKTGIYKKNGWIPSKKFTLLKWEEIETCYVSDNSNKGVADYNLNFTNKADEKRTRLSLSGYDKNMTEIIAVVEKYSKLFGFGYLGLD